MYKSQNRVGIIPSPIPGEINDYNSDINLPILSFHIY
jgi:hypothetical protein